MLINDGPFIKTNLGIEIDTGLTLADASDVFLSIKKPIGTVAIIPFAELTITGPVVSYTLKKSDVNKVGTYQFQVTSVISDNEYKSSILTKQFFDNI